MNDPLLADALSTPIVGLLDEQFSRARLEALLGQAGASLDGEVWNRALHAPLRDFLERPGKEFRGNLVRTSYELAGGAGTCPEVLPAVIEIVHAGSLIVDDIQDQSPTRRGRPAMHVEYGLPVALNCGNWLYFWAYDLISQSRLEPAIQWQLLTTTSRALLACHYGQALDLTLNVHEIEQARLHASVEAATELKTGALMELAAVLGARAAGGFPERVASLGRFGRTLGCVLQMLDDLSGLLSERRCHKGHEDLIGGRPTWPWAWLADELPVATFESLQQMSADVQLRDLHPELLARELRRRLSGSGRMRVRRTIHSAFATLRDEVGNAPGLDAIQAEINRLEKSYV